MYVFDGSYSNILPRKWRSKVADDLLKLDDLTLLLWTCANTDTCKFIHFIDIEKLWMFGSNGVSVDWIVSEQNQL